MNKHLYILICFLLFNSLPNALQAYYVDNFETPYQTIGSQPNGWSSSSGVIVSNGSGAIKHNLSSLYIPVLSVVSNSYNGNETKILTDFYTIPRKFVSDAANSPTIDLTSTSQFFVNSNGMWTTFSRCNGLLVTNIWLTTLNGATYPTVNQYSVFYHISVLHNYTDTNWSLFVNNIPIATNLGFIASGVTNHEWVQIQNLGGNISNSCWLDDFSMTNMIVDSLTNCIQGTQIPIVSSLFYFNSLSDPRPTNKTITANSNNINLTFGRTSMDGRNYIVYGTTDYYLSNLNSNGIVKEDSFSDNTPLLNSSKRYFYKLITLSSDGNFSVTNDETYAIYKQDRDINRAYISGVPIEIRDGDRTLGGTLGKQLAYGLNINDTLTLYNNGIEDTYTVQAGGTWSGANLNTIIPLGKGVMIKRLNNGGSSITVLAGTIPTNNIPPITINAGRNILSWVSGTNGSLLSITGLTAESEEDLNSYNDYVYVQQWNTDILLERYTSTGWKTGLRVGGGINLNPQLMEGSGVIIWHVGGAALWNP